ncbi:Rv3235 family protein [Ruania rhizosphaerae]|uniref:Rv3235 family protein n=1 Tax=Ruania rhizosphaerae TaxID=1840413 RepID=UPI0023B28BC6|nr:Rv3235 family protein [Ruania rhizosphaerae]
MVWSRGRAPERTDPQQWAGVLVRACAEALLGVRPAAQLSRWLDPAVWSALSRRSALAMDLRGRPRLPRPMTVRRVIGGAVTEAVWEGSVILDDGTRVRGVAVRLEDHRGRWRATALRIG